MELLELYESANKIDNTYYNVLRNKYILLASLGITPGAYLDINDVISTNNLPIKNYVEKFKEVILFPNFINNKLVDLFIRPINKLETPLTYKTTDFLFPYGIGQLREGFKFGDTLFVVEGIGDYGALKLIDKNIDVVAIRTNSFPKNSYEFFASLTNNIVMIPDNDKAGLGGLNKVKNTFSKLEVNFNYFKQFGDFKDTGDFVDLLINYKKTKSESLRKEIELARNYYLTNIKLHGGLKNG